MTGKVGLRFRWEQALRQSELPSTARHIGHLMATYATKDGARIFPGVPRLARESGWSVRTVKSALRTLREQKWVVVVREGTSAGNKTTEYRLTIPVQEAPARGAASASGGAADDGWGAPDVPPTDQFTRSRKRPPNSPTTTSSKTSDPSPSWDEMTEAEQAALIALAPPFD